MSKEEGGKGYNITNEPRPYLQDKRFRQAINYAIDRDELVQVGWQGAGEKTLLPLPDYPPLQPYLESVDDLLDAHAIGVHATQRTAQILTRKGWVRENRYWTKDGERFKIVIDIPTVLQDLGPVLVAQLQRAGFDAIFRMTQDFYTRVTQGTARAFLMGHAGSTRDPYFTLSLYHSRHNRPTGTFAEYPWRWSNSDFDAIVEQMSRTAPDDPALREQYRQAMGIWLQELPSIPLVQWMHRIAHNQTYWRGWPSADDPYVHSAYWHRTWGLVLLRLRPTS
ncbi:MAG: hypothetical protein HOH74_04970 [Gemmatimonadetes bacterium]|nr:hypothetical protein [Gemmatimonadota bacterium]